MGGEERERERPTFVFHDGRRISVQTAGDPRGFPVFLLHGMPGSRLGPRPRGIVLHRLGIRLISYDRPGYGKSVRKRGRTVADAGEDIVAIADALDIDRFSLVGRSAGGAHALACAAYVPDRVVRTAVLVGTAPSDATGLDWYGGMARSNTSAFSEVDEKLAAREDEHGLALRLYARASEVSADPESMLRTLMPDLAQSDRRVVEAPAMGWMLTQSYAEAVRESGDGWVDDAIALRSNWGFNLEQVTSPVLLWHGTDDRFVPASHTLWLADRLRATRDDPESVQVRIVPRVAHFGAVEILPDILGWLSERRALAI